MEKDVKLFAAFNTLSRRGDVPILVKLGADEMRGNFSTAASDLRPVEVLTLFDREALGAGKASVWTGGIVMLLEPFGLPQERYFFLIR